MCLIVADSFCDLPKLGSIDNLETSSGYYFFMLENQIVSQLCVLKWVIKDFHLMEGMMQVTVIHPWQAPLMHFACSPFLHNVPVSKAAMEFAEKQ